MSVSKLFRLIACRIQGVHNNNIVIAERERDDINRLVREFMPSGSGFDGGTTFEIDKSNRLKMVFKTAFHHMDDNGYYDGWTHHDVIVTPNFGGFDIRITGRDRNNIKDYIGEVFENAFQQDINHVWDNETLSFEFALQAVITSPAN